MVATLNDAMRAMWARGRSTPRSWSEATASDTRRAVSLAFCGSYQRENVTMPSGTVRSRNTRHAWRV
jgi:hypothetical protein